MPSWEGGWLVGGWVIEDSTTQESEDIPSVPLLFFSLREASKLHSKQPISRKSKRKTTSYELIHPT